MFQEFIQLLQKFDIKLGEELDLGSRKTDFTAQAAHINFAEELNSCIQLILTHASSKQDAPELVQLLLTFHSLLQAKIIVESPEKSLVLNADSLSETLEKILAAYSNDELAKLIALQHNEAAELSRGKIAFIMMNLVTMAQYTLSKRLEIKLDLAAIMQATPIETKPNDDTQQASLADSLLGLQRQFQAARTLSPNFAHEKNITDQVRQAGGNSEGLINSSAENLTSEQKGIAKCYTKREEEVGRGKSYAITASLKESTENLTIEALKRAYRDELQVSDESLQDFHIHALLQATRIADGRYSGLGIGHVLQNCLNDFILCISDPTVINTAEILILNADNRKFNARPVPSQPGAVQYAVEVEVICQQTPVGMLHYDFIIDANKQLSINSAVFTLNELTKERQDKLVNNAAKEFATANCCFINGESKQQAIEFTDFVVKPNKTRLLTGAKTARPIDTLPAAGLKSGAAIGGIIGGVLGATVATLFSPVLGPFALLVFAGITLAGSAIGAGTGYLLGKGLERLTAPANKPSDDNRPNPSIHSANPYKYPTLQKQPVISESDEQKVQPYKIVVDGLKQRFDSLQQLPKMRPISVANIDCLTPKTITEFEHSGDKQQTLRV